MKVVLKNSKEEVIDKIIRDINSNNRYVGDGYKIAGKVDTDKLYLNLEDRRDKSSKFLNEVFYGNVEEVDDKTVIKGRFRIDTLPLVLFLILIVVALETLIVSFAFNGFNNDMFLPGLILGAVIIYLISFKKRSEITNKYIENYLTTLFTDI